MSVNPLGKGIELGGGPAFKVRAVFSLTIELEVVLVLQIGELG